MKWRMILIVLSLILSIFIFLVIFMWGSDVEEDEVMDYGVGFKTTASVLDVTDINPFGIQTNPFEVSG
jgi:small-conductance mechanosensitive channel